MPISTKVGMETTAMNHKTIGLALPAVGLAAITLHLALIQHQCP